ncbi:trypsin-like peptidase domain-containing protein [Verrucomicrobiaceae bacterium N1E253]|uniref:Trypsin-like peptidase domain-containing protein n=1 Tax=Oceaniferula marina TaxID=2748318 RepID=A0A851GD20_9BACT|nr:trypsin-like peptidase domain-containing protein [Oceaniferula marina]NWK55316.1 trypsin-like peptidase domain-containing protein [Oceaniferula marina]
MNDTPRFFTRMSRAGALTCALASSIGICLAVPAVDDMQIRQELAKKVGELVDAKKTTSGEELAKQLDRKSCSFKLPKPANTKPHNLYTHCADSVVAVASVYKCSKCTKWHGSGAATGWVLSEDGLMVTNYHVFEGKSVAGFGIRTRDGRFAPITEIVAADKASDVAIFRVEGKDFKPLPVGPDAEVGNDIHIIAHPDSNFYTYTAGQVSRYYLMPSRKKNKPLRMAVTAEFAKGSSGGPVLDSTGNVVGMVASTRTIYYPPKKKEDTKGPMQMVIRSCVPVQSIRALIKDPS